MAATIIVPLLYVAPTLRGGRGLKHTGQLFIGRDGQVAPTLRGGRGLKRIVHSPLLGGRP